MPHRVAIAAVVAAVAVAADGHSTPPTGDIVSVRAVTDARTIAAGEPFHLGVELTMKPGWHVYWKYPGDAGLSTELSFELPEGFVAGDVRYPVPMSFAQPGEIAGYGYEDRVTLFAEITPPAELETGESSFEITADWLACANVCVPGRASRRVTLPVEARAERGDAAEGWLAALPLGAEGMPPFAEHISAAKTAPETATVTLRLRWFEAPPDEVEWIPDVPDAIEIRNVSVRTGGQETHVTFTAGLLAGQTLEAETMESVVTYRSQGGELEGALVPIRIALLGPAPDRDDARMDHHEQGVGRR